MSSSQAERVPIGKRSLAISLVLLMVFSSFGMISMTALANQLAPNNEEPKAPDHSTTIVKITKSDFNNGEMVTAAVCPGSATTATTYVSGDVTWTGTCTFNGPIYIYSGSSLTLSGATLHFNWNTWSYNYNYGTFKVYNSTIDNIGSYRWIMYSWNWGGPTANLYYDSSTISGADYYMAYCSSCGVIYANNTNFKSGSGYGIMTYSTSSTTITNNTFDGFGYYGVYVQNAGSNTIYNNTFKNCQAGMYLYMGAPEIRGNRFISNSQYGLYLYNTYSYVVNNTFTNNALAGIYNIYNGITIENCSFQSNGVDIWVEGNGQSPIVKVINCPVNKIRVDQGSGGGKSEVQVYWFANITVKWLRDDTPVADAKIEIFDNAYTLLSEDLATDGNGKIEWLPVMEYSVKQTGKASRTPHIVNITKRLGQQLFYNSTEMVISYSPNNVELKLDNVPPPLLIVSPENGMITNTSKIMISGYTEANVLPLTKPVSVLLDVNDRDYKPFVDMKGNFKQEVSVLKEGSNKVKVTAYDWVKNSVSTDLTFTLDTKNPLLLLETPIAGTLMNVTTVTVTGKAEIGAHVFVKGVETSLDINGFYSQPVALSEGVNTIDVLALDRANNSLNANTWVEVDTIPPAVTITEPYDGMVTNQHNIKVTGITESKAAVSVENNPVMIMGSSYQTSMNLVEGQNTLTVTAVDKAGNVNKTSIKVLLDDTPPTLVVDSPLNNLLTKDDIVKVVGCTDPDATLIIDNQEVSTAGGAFSYDVYLKEGKNRITIDAMDKVGNRISTTKTIVLDTIAPILVLEEPSEDAVVTIPDIDLVGTTDADAKLTLNGKKIPNMNGQFKIPFLLDEGINDIVIETSDEIGNTRLVHRTMTLDTQVEFLLSSPKNGTVTNERNITFEGKVEPGGEVVIGKTRVNTRSDGSFKANVELRYGENQIRVVAKDRLSNLYETQFVVTSTSQEAKQDEEDNSKYGQEQTESMLVGDNLNMLLMFLMIIIGLAVVAGVGQAVISRDRKKMKIDESMNTDLTQKKEADYQEQYAKIYAETAAAVYSGAPIAPTKTRAHGVLGIPEETIEGYAISEEAKTTLKVAMKATSEVEETGADTSEMRRLLRLSHGLAMKGDSEKVTVYGRKIMSIAAGTGVEVTPESAGLAAPAAQPRPVMRPVPVHRQVETPAPTPTETTQASAQAQTDAPKPTCPNCGKNVKPLWKSCPFCATEF